MIEWLYRSSIELFVIVTLLLVLAPLLRRILNVQTVYWLWIIPLLTIVFWQKPERPKAVLEVIGLPAGGVSLSTATPPDLLVIENIYLLIGVWLIGVCLWLTMRLYGWLSLQRLLKTTSSRLQLPEQLTRRLPKRFKNVEARYYKTDIASAPFVTGISEAKIFLPNDFFQKYKEEEQIWVVVHELSHVQRRDLWVQLLVELIRACFWFNPIVHFAWSYFREDQELACDYHATKNCTAEERLQYGKAMLQGMSANLLPATMAFFTLRKERFIMLHKHKKSNLKNILGISLCILLSVLVVTKAPTTVATPRTPDEGVTLQFKSTPLEAVTRLIADYLNKVVVNPEILSKNDSKLTMEIVNVPAEKVLALVLECTGFDYQLNKDTIEIFENRTDKMQKQRCLDMTTLSELPDSGGEPEKFVMSPLPILEKSYEEQVISLINGGGNISSVNEFYEMHVQSQLRPLRVLVGQIEAIHKKYGKLESTGLKQVRILNEANGLTLISFSALSKSTQQKFYFNMFVAEKEAGKILMLDLQADNIAEAPGKL